MTNRKLGIKIPAGWLGPADVGNLLLMWDKPPKKGHYATRPRWVEIYSVEQIPWTSESAYNKPLTVVGYMPRRWIRKRRHLSVKFFADTKIKVRR